jgi:hypothetical protein
LWRDFYQIDISFKSQSHRFLDAHNTEGFVVDANEAHIKCSDFTVHAVRTFCSDVYFS